MNDDRERRWSMRGAQELLEGGDLRAALSEDLLGQLRWYRRGGSGRVPGLGRAIALDIAQGKRLSWSQRELTKAAWAVQVVIQYERR